MSALSKCKYGFGSLASLGQLMVLFYIIYIFLVIIVLGIALKLFWLEINLRLYAKNGWANKFSQQWMVAEKLTEPKALQLLVGKDFTMKDISKNGMLYHQRRILEDGQLLFVVNTNTTKKAVSKTTMKGKSVTKFDLVTGKTFQIHADATAETMKAICAVVERPQLWQVSVNGKNVSKIEGSYWIEKEFPLYKVGEFLHTGENTTTLSSNRMTIFTELMPICLIGDFLVKPGNPGFQITEGQMNDLGSWNKNGMPFYSQKVAYSQEFEINNVAKKAYKVKLNQWSGTVAEVWVNGKQAGEIAWQPYEMDVTPYVKSGRNEITVKIIGSLKNTFGYFYKNNNFWIAGPWDWDGAPQKTPAASDYYLLNYGLNEPFELIKTNK